MALVDGQPGEKHQSNPQYTSRERTEVELCFVKVVKLPRGPLPKLDKNVPFLNSIEAAPFISLLFF